MTVVRLSVIKREETNLFLLGRIFMRMRKMRNLEPRTEKCAAYRITEPASLKGNWRSLKPDCTALWVEVGCGKGKFTAETAEANPDVLLIAVA